jgi:hypothetical protein
MRVTAMTLAAVRADGSDLHFTSLPHRLSRDRSSPHGVAHRLPGPARCTKERGAGHPVRSRRAKGTTMMHDTPGAKNGPINRRRFLGLGAGAVAATGASTLLARRAHGQGTSRPRRFVIREDRFGRLFPQLDPFFNDVSPRLLNALREIGKPGGMLDARDALDKGPILLITDSALSANNPNKVIDTRISTPLFNLPLAAIASGDPPTALPQRNLLRHVTWSIPSGQSIARAMRVPALTGRDFPELREFRLGLDESTPLWYYVLRKGAVAEGGLAAAPTWRPSLPTRSGRVTGDFRMVDFLTFAGVDPASRKQ